MLMENLLVASFMVFVTFAIHFAGLVALAAFLRERQHKLVNVSTLMTQGASIMLVVMGLFALHSIQIWLYTGMYMVLGEFEDVETAVYFSTSAFTTVGFGDVTLSENWRMLGAAESANGFLLIGWSTAFLVTVTSRIRVFEERIERLDD